MIKTSKLLIIMLSSLVLFSGSSCRKKGPEVGATCTRLSDCFKAYSSKVTDATLKKSIEDSINLADEAMCASSIKELGKIKAIQDQGGCPF